MINQIDPPYGQQHTSSIYKHQGPWGNPKEAKWIWLWEDYAHTKIECMAMNSRSGQDQVERAQWPECASSVHSLHAPPWSYALIVLSLVSASYLQKCCQPGPSIHHLCIERFCELGWDFSLISQIVYATGKKIIRIIQIIRKKNKQTNFLSKDKYGKKE